MVRAGSRTVEIDRLVLARWSDLLVATAEALVQLAPNSEELVERVISEIDAALRAGGEGSAYDHHRS